MAKRRIAELRLDPDDRAPTSDEGRGMSRAKWTDPRRNGGGSGNGGGNGNGSSGGGRPPKAPKKPRRRWGWTLVRWSLVAGIWSLIVLAGVFAYFAMTLPETGDLMSTGRKPSTTLVAADGTLIATYGDLYGETLKLSEMSPYIRQAVLATEDRRFYSHFGVDPIGLLRAAFRNATSGRVVQGGSTITQQLAKNLFLTPERTMARKIQEVLLAFWLEHKFTKDQILEIYLNRVYLGAGTYGVDAACWRYFDHSARKATAYEAAIVAGLLKAPTRFSPARDRDRSAARASQVLANMVEAGYLTQQQADAAERQKTQLAQMPVQRPGLRYFADYLIEFVADFGGPKRGDLLVVTTIDSRLQAAAEAAVQETLAKDGAKANAGQGAVVAMSPDGAIRAMVGGRDYQNSQFNRATQALRQPGSSFKPIVYAAALEAGMTPDTRMVDGPIRIGDWSPRNYTGRYLGEVTLAEALAQSLNTVAVQVAERAGLARVATMARRLGITADLTPDASIALGTSEVTLLELTSAYAAFASGGYGAWPYGILEIRDAKNNVLFRRSGGGPGRVIPAEIAGAMTEMMTGVIGHGTGRSAAIDRPAAGKTGTTQDYRDALFVGYTGELVAGVWFGNDDNSSMNRVTGGTLPARAWRSFMLAALKGVPAAPLPTGPAREPGSFLERLFGASSREPARAPAPAPAPIRSPLAGSPNQPYFNSNGSN
jgi:penicillin-binding protein 1A